MRCVKILRGLKHLGKPANYNKDICIPRNEEHTTQLTRQTMSPSEAPFGKLCCHRASPPPQLSRRRSTYLSRSGLRRAHGGPRSIGSLLSVTRFHVSDDAIAVRKMVRSKRNFFSGVIFFSVWYPWKKLSWMCMECVRMLHVKNIRSN